MSGRWLSTLDEAIAQYESLPLTRLTDEAVGAILADLLHERMHECPSYPCPEGGTSDYGDYGDDLLEALIEVRARRAA